MKKVYLLLILAIFSAGSFAQTVSVFDGAGYYDDFVIGNSRYFVSESIYTDAELGSGNFLTAGSAIQRINFFMVLQGAPAAVNSYTVWMKNVPIGTTAFTDGAYTTTGYTQVYTGTFNATPVGVVGINLTTPFTRAAGTNLQVLIERKDNVLHPGFGFEATLGNSVDGLANSSRTYSSTVLPVSGTTNLIATPIRPAMQFVHTFAVDAEALLIGLPLTSCYNSPQTVGVYVYNAGTLPIAAGAVSTTLRIRGANSFTGTLTNSAIIAAGGFELVNFTGINLNNLGDNFDTAFVNLAGDGTTYNDTIIDVSAAAATLSSFPLVEDVEGLSQPVFTYVQALSLGQLWDIWDGDYTNDDQITPLTPRAPGTAAFIFDSYSGGNSNGYQSRLFSDCIDLTTVASPVVSFWMSHDNIFVTDLDSLYLSVSADKGVTWTRLAGFRRPDAMATTPLWRQETVSLAAYASQTIQLGFEGVSKWGNAFLLDDITISGVLPVTVLSFDAKRNGGVNILNWRTSQELNSNKFIIERSTDGGRNYASIGEVAAAGISNTERSYRFTDNSPVKGFNYYRLRIVDLDNTFKYSAIRNVRNLGTADLSFAPNPVQQQMNVKLEADKADKAVVTITDMSGKQMYNNKLNVTAGTNNIIIETGKLAQGTYIITVQLSNDKIVKIFNKL